MATGGSKVTTLGFVTGSRWARLDVGLKLLAWQHGLDIDLVIERKGLKQVVHFRLRGPKKSVEDFFFKIRNGIRENGKP